MAKTKLRIKTVAEVVAEIRDALRRTAEKYIPQIAEAVKSEHPNLSKQQRRQRIEEVCREFWSPTTVLMFLPMELKDKEKSDAGKLGKEASTISRQRSSALMSSGTDNDELDQIPQSRNTVPIDEELDHDESLEDRYSSVALLIEDLSGQKQDKQSKNNLELVEQTRQHRLHTIKKMSDLDVRTTYTYCRTLALLLNDFMKQLDDELDVRQNKERMTGV